MFHKISNVKALPNLMLWAEFCDGTEVVFNVHLLLTQNSLFSDLSTTAGLFEQVKVDTGGYGISWNDDIDLDAEEIWANGIIVKQPETPLPGCNCPTCGQKIRRKSLAQATASRANLAKRTHKGGRPINPNSKRQQLLAKKSLC